MNFSGEIFLLALEEKVGYVIVLSYWARKLGSLTGLGILQPVFLFVAIHVPTHSDTSASLLKPVFWAAFPKFT